MNNLKEILKKKQTFSFELFPPKTDQGFINLQETIRKLALLSPDFISCTYGAGGGARDKTFDIVEIIQNQHNIIGVAHLTCVLNTKDEIKKILEDVKTRKINHILALRGDPPTDNPNWQPQNNNFKYSSELCSFIRQNFKDYFGIGVAGFPEGHVLCPDKDQDARYLQMKVDQGADFVITQLFFDNQDYFDYTKRLKKIGVTIPVLAGIFPILDYPGLVNFCKRCGAKVPEKVKKIFEPIAHDKEATLKAGTEYAIEQCKELLKAGASGIHFYCLNKVSPSQEILNNIR